jgi:hypothetical protein
MYEYAYSFFCGSASKRKKQKKETIIIIIIRHLDGNE